MTTFEKNEIRSRLFSICFTLMFLIGSTWLWFGPRADAVRQRKLIENKTYALAESLVFNEITPQIDVNSQKKVSDSESINLDAYEFSVKNNTNKDVEYLISFRHDLSKNENDNCRIIPNNYIKYRIKKNDEEYSDIRVLSLDGKIYVDNLKSKDTSVYSIQYWIDDNYDMEGINHFHSKITLTDNNKVKS